MHLSIKDCSGRSFVSLVSPSLIVRSVRNGMPTVEADLFPFFANDLIFCYCCYPFISPTVFPSFFYISNCPASWICWSRLGNPFLSPLISEIPDTLEVHI